MGQRRRKSPQNSSRHMPARWLSALDGSLRPSARGPRPGRTNPHQVTGEQQDLLCGASASLLQNPHVCRRYSRTTDALSNLEGIRAVNLC